MPCTRRHTRAAACRTRCSGRGSSRHARADLRDARARLLTLVNLSRQAAGIRLVTACAELDKSSHAYAHELAFEQGRLSHMSARGKSLFDRVQVSYKPRRVAEVLGRGQRTPERVVSRWLKSTSHRRVVLCPRVEKMGCAAVRDGEGRVYWVMHFAEL